eukprot:1158988-Pelagomonas_calceolata.AAC.7
MHSHDSNTPLQRMCSKREKIPLQGTCLKRGNTPIQRMRSRELQDSNTTIYTMHLKRVGGNRGPQT